MSDSIKTQLRSYYDCVDAGDQEGLLALFSDDCVYRRPGYEPLRGKSALAQFYRDDRIIDRGRHELEDLVVEGHTAATCGRFTGTLKNGEEVDVGFAEIFKFADGLIQERTTYFYRPAV